MPVRREKPPRSPQPDIARARYVAFRVQAKRGLGRPAVIAAIRAAARRLGPEAEAAKPWLTRFDGSRGILRCEHTGKEAAIAVLRAVRDVDGLEVHVETVGTSGTIAGCVRKFLPDLEDRDEPRKP